VADNSLVGTWVGEGELQPCLLNIAFDPSEKVYNIAMSKSAEAKEEMKCTEISAKGHLVQFGSQRFLDVSPLMKNPWQNAQPDESQARQATLVLVPMDVDWLADAIRGKTLDLTARIDEKLSRRLTSFSLLRPGPAQLLRKSGDAEGAFSDKDQMRFHQK